MPRFLAGLLLTAALAHPETAIVESRAEARIRIEGRGEILLMDFRTASIENWTIRKATLLLHVREGSSPKHLEIAPIASRWTEENPATARTGLPRNTSKLAVTAMPQGWISIEVPPSLAAASRNFGLAVVQDKVVLHGRAPAYYSFHMLVEGEPSK